LSGQKSRPTCVVTHPINIVGGRRGSTSRLSRELISAIIEAEIGGVVARGGSHDEF
jgi:hypothetical protein